MVEYLPWSEFERNISLKFYRQKIFSIMDFELGGDCNLNCIYCDSPDRSIKVTFDINSIERFLKENYFRWLFICGIGEPSAGENYVFFIKLLEMCEKYKLRCSSFTNILNLNGELLNFVEKGILCLKIKLDSLRPERIKYLYGLNHYKVIIENINIIKEIVMAKEGCTNIAASIVPTKINYDEIDTLIKLCIDNAIFPLIGHLEYSGRAIIKQKELALTDDEHKKMYTMIKEKYNIDYQLPVCPSVTTGIRIDSEGNVILDKETGLTCNWLWLKTPIIQKLKNIETYTCSTEIFDNIFNFRQSKLQNVKELLEKETLPSGGCGGDVRKVLEYYLSMIK